MKGQKILKVTSILMIIGGVIAVVVGVLAILGISALAALSGSTEGIGLLYASSILVRGSAPAATPRRQLPASSGALSLQF